MTSVYFVFESGTMPFSYFAVFLSFLGFLMFFLPLVPISLPPLLFECYCYVMLLLIRHSIAVFAHYPPGFWPYLSQEAAQLAPGQSPGSGASEDSQCRKGFCHCR